MRNKYALLFKDMNEQSWKELRDKCLTKEGFRQYWNMDIKNNTIKYYDEKFHYTPLVTSSLKNEIGNHYGKLIVISYAGTNSRREALWKCKCECGKEVIRSGILLREKIRMNMCNDCNKLEKSQRFWKDLSGEIINELQVIKRIGSREGSGNVIYQCKCLRCGNIIEVSSDALSHQISCGCINSRGEYLINKILNELNIPYKTQYKFPDCIYTSPLKFDFAIFKNNQVVCLIEFQGIQHYLQTNGNWNDTNEQFQIRQERDNIKRSYCLEHKIPLIEIPYTEITKLNKNYILSLINQYIN